MANEVDTMMAATTETEMQIVGTSPQIIVTGTADKPFFQIMYREGDGIHLGYGSYELAFVFQWLKEYFGITDAMAIDPEKLRPNGHWKKHKNMHGFVYCSACRGVYLDVEWLADGKWTFCPNCGAKMEGIHE